MPPNNLYFFDLPADTSPEWLRLFQLMEADFGSRDNLMGRTKTQFREARNYSLKNMDILNEFDAVLSATAQKDRGNEYFKQGLVGRAHAMYFGAINTAPLPSALLNLAAVSLKQHMYLAGVMFATRALAFDELLKPVTKAKALYRRCVSRRLLSHEGKHLREALQDVKLAHELDPENAEIKSELTLVEHMLTLSFVQLKKTIQNQRDALPQITARDVMMDEDAKITAREARVNCTRHYPADWNYRTASVAKF